MDPLRIIDANVNRAREALRTAEEAARFLLEDAGLAAEAKHLRHALMAAVTELEAGFGGRPRSAARDTPGDVGTRIQGAGEGSRAGAADVVGAATARLGESLRTIEEWSKTDAAAVAGGLPEQVEALRYRGYELERRLLAAIRRRTRPQWRVCVLVTEAACGGRPWTEVAAAAIAGGADCLQLREPGMLGGELLRRARHVRAIAAAAAATSGGSRAAVVVNDRPDVALAAGADGVHVGQGDLPAAEIRRLAGERLVVGVSTSRMEEARAALAAGADGCGVGPMHASGTKHKDRVVGADYLRAYLEWDRLPHLAIGGIDAGRARTLAGLGARGVAVCAAVCGAGDPEAATRAIVEAMLAGASSDEAKTTGSSRRKGDEARGVAS